MRICVCERVDGIRGTRKWINASGVISFFGGWRMLSKGLLASSLPPIACNPPIAQLLHQS